MKKLFCILLCAWGIYAPINAQTFQIDSLQNLGVCDANGLCIPKINTMIRPKGFSITRQSIMEYDIKTKFRDSTRSRTDRIDQNESLEIKLKLPLALREEYNLIIGFAYKVEEFEFDNPTVLKNEFHQHLEDKPLRSLGTTLYLDKRYKGRHYLFTRVGMFLNGDFTDGGQLFDYFRSSVTTIYGTKVNRWKTWGAGLSYSYRFGALAIYPLLHYNKQFTEHFGFEMTLPVKTEFRYRMNDKNLFYFTNRLGGDNYILNFDELSDQSLFLRKSHFLSFITYEREIYDFLWLMVSTGVRANINFDLSQNNRIINNDVPFIDNSLGTAPIMSFGVFIVPPRRWMRTQE